MTRPRILIITSGQLSQNPRVPKEAGALSRAGYEVTVVRVANSRVYHQYDNELLRAAGFACVTVNQIDGTLTERARAFVDRSVTRLARRAVRRGRESEYALGPIASLLAAARRLPSDLTIVHTEAPFAVGRRLQRNGRHVAADFEDWHSQDLLPEARAQRPIRLLTQLERDLMRAADYVSTTSECLSEALHSAYGAQRPVVVRNTFPNTATAPATGRSGRPPRLFWFSQTIGAGRGLERFVDAWANTQADSDLHLLGDCTPHFRRALESRCPVRKRERLQFRPVVDPSKLPAVIAEHDLGLALEMSTPASRDLTITNKILQYVAGGLGVLATPTRGQCEVQRLAPEAVVLLPDDSAALTRILDEICDDADRVGALRAAAAVAHATNLAWDRDAERLVDAVHRVLPLP